MNKNILLSKYLLIGILVLIVFVPTILSNLKIPNRDSGVYLYTGWQILNDKFPYLDVWDHKPPLIYYIDALGLFIGNGSMLGIFFLEYIAIYSAAILGFIFIKKVFGLYPAIFGTILWLFSFIQVMLGYGNLTEEFALPFQFLILNLFLNFEIQNNIKSKNSYSWNGFFIGFISGLSFLLKPNIIGIFLSIIILLFITRILTRNPKILKNFISILLGLMTLIIIVFIYFGIHNIIDSFVDQVFRYNFIYSSTTFDNRFKSVINGINILYGISYIALFSWFIGIFYIIYGKNENIHKILSLSIIALPIELFLGTISGLEYKHYYASWLPILAIFSGFFAYIFMSVYTFIIDKLFHLDGIDKRYKRYIKNIKVNLSVIWLFVLIILAIHLPVKSEYNLIIRPNQNQISRLAVEYIQNNTNESDYILMWGAETSVNFVSHRQSPTRYVYQYPLYKNGYRNEKIIREFLNDIKNNKPVLIIDTSSTNPVIPPINATLRNKWKSKSTLLPEMNEVFKYIDNNYKFIGKIRRWSIYKYMKFNENTFP